MEKNKINNIELTDEEKINLLANIKMYSADNKIKNNLWNMKMISITEIIASTLGGAFICFSGMSITAVFLVLGLLVATTTPLLELTIIPTLVSNLKEFKEYTNGKLSYKQYKKLVKSGEVAKWQQQYKEQIEQKVNEFKGIEIAEYRQDAEEQIISDFYDNLTQTDVQLDADKIAEEVRRMVNENNKNNSSEQQR